ncbi:MAG: two-component system response regulator [Zoogloea sp.]|uniref:HD-GYP domain-containing protein n=1 Tax=Zoogloea sp. TaxID=49181 RepID=UPI0026284D48|nr:two-component system response regulator [Zoogloea sp.]MDD2989918.1 two-component system response regulator [Zoogloea sp.]
MPPPSDPHHPLILVVDDAPDSIEPIVNCLHRAGFRTRIATNGERALALAVSKPLPDLILLDISMPDRDGYEVCRQLMDDPLTANIPVIFLSIRNEEVDEQLGFDAGAVDYITKPISPPLVLTRIRNHLTLKAASDFLRDRNHYLENEVIRRTRELGLIQDATIVAMASLAETRDNETGNHIRRTQMYLRALARHLQHHPRFSAELSDGNIELMYKSAPLHDIGKVGIPDRILLKPGKLTAAEFEIMKTHTTLGRDAIAKAEALFGISASFLRFAKEIAYSHQEKWDGSGYPLGLAGDRIPLSARLMAVADVYDALISQRVYKPALSHDEAVALLQDGRGKHFDPDILDAFLSLQGEFQQIAQRFADSADQNGGTERTAERLRIIFGN